MDFQAKHLKILKSIQMATLKNFLECLSSVEYTLETCNPALLKAIVPLEANFQLPNIFLKTKKAFKIENLFSDKNLAADWNDELATAILYIDNIELECSGNNKDPEVDILQLESMLKWRNGKF